MPSLDVNLSAVVHHIQSEHHGRMRLLLSEAALLLASACEEKDAAARSLLHPLLQALDRAFAYFRANLLAHFRTEEAVVFPYIVALHQAYVRGDVSRGGRVRRFASVASPVQLIRNEEEGTRRAMVRLLRALAAARDGASAVGRLDAFDAAIQALNEELEAHSAIEEDVLFPVAADVERAITRRATMLA